MFLTKLPCVLSCRPQMLMVREEKCEENTPYYYCRRRLKYPEKNLSGVLKIYKLNGAVLVPTVILITDTDSITIDLEHG